MLSLRFKFTEVDSQRCVFSILMGWNFKIAHEFDVKGFISYARVLGLELSSNVVKT
jgi:hypothetical protein